MLAECPDYLDCITNELEGCLCLKQTYRDGAEVPDDRAPHTDDPTGPSEDPQQ